MADQNSQLWGSDLCDWMLVLSNYWKAVTFSGAEKYIKTVSWSRGPKGCNLAVSKTLNLWRFNVRWAHTFPARELPQNCTCTWGDCDFGFIYIKLRFGAEKRLQQNQPKSAQTSQNHPSSNFWINGFIHLIIQKLPNSHSFPVSHWGFGLQSSCWNVSTWFWPHRLKLYAHPLAKCEDVHRRAWRWQRR